MDPLGVLLGVAALALFPGGLFLGAIAGLVAWAGRTPAGPRRSWTASEVIGCGLAGLAVSLAPLPASPAQTLPPGVGASSNVVAVLLLMAAALAVALSPSWPWPRVVAGAAAMVAVLALAVGTSTLAFSTLNAVPGGAISVARTLAGISLLGGAPLLASPGDGGVNRWVRAVMTASLSILGLTLFVPALLPGQPAWLVAAIVAAAATVHAAAEHQLRTQFVRRSSTVAGLTASAAAAAVVLAVLSGA